MEVLDLIYHQLLFNANDLGRKPRTSRYFQPPTPQTLALAVADNHCALSEYASAKKDTVLFSEGEYPGTVCASPVINFTPEASALINHTVVGRLIPSAAQLHYDRYSLILIGAPQPRVKVIYFVPHSIPLSMLLNSHQCTSVWIVGHRYSVTHSLPHPQRGAPPLVWALFNPHWCSPA